MMAKLAEPLRICRDCGLEADTEDDLDLFEKNKKSKYGRKNLCDKCRNARKRKYYEAHPEKMRKRAQKYSEAYPEKIRERGRKYREVNREKINERNRKHHKENPEKRREYQRKYYAANREMIRERRRKHRDANLMKEREYHRKYYAANPFQLAIKYIKTRSKKNGLPFDLTKEYLEQLWDECGGICSMTGIKMRKSSKPSDPLGKSIDRIDPEKGYTKGNVRLVSYWYNRTRNNWGDKLTVEMCQQVADRAYSSKMIEVLETEGGKVK